MAKRMFRIADKDGFRDIEGTAVNVTLNSGAVVPCFINEGYHSGTFGTVLTHKASGMIIGKLSDIVLEYSLRGDKISLSTAAGYLLRRIESRLGAAVLLAKLNAAPKIGN